MFDKLLKMAAANGLVTGLRVGPNIGNQYQVHIWIGPRIGDRHEWYERFDLDTPQREAINAVAGKALDYCLEHLNCRRVADEVTAA